MAKDRMSKQIMDEALAAVAQHGSVAAASRALRVPLSTMRHRTETAKIFAGGTVAALTSVPAPVPAPVPVPTIEDILGIHRLKEQLAKSNSVAKQAKAHANAE